MNARIEIVFRGWLNLTNDEKHEFSKEANKYINETMSGRKSIKENTDRRVVLGPLSSAKCLCCGK